MVINSDLIIVYEQEATEIKIDHIVEDVIISIPYKIHDVAAQENPVKTDIIMGKLRFACDENNRDVILIIGYIGFVERQLVTEAVRNVISDSEQLSKNVKLSLLNIEKRLNYILPHEGVCGIRNQSLIIGLFGPDEHQIIECLDGVANMIHLIRTDKGENVPLHDVASTSDNISIKQNASTIKRHKESFSMISFQDALLKMHEVVTENQEGATGETVQLSDACGRILFETVKAAYDLPPFKTSTKHGYAVLIDDGKCLRKVLNVENTFPSMSLEPGTCVWVNSGAPIPDGATAVVQVKDTKLVESSDDADEKYIEIIVEPEYEQNIKPVGYDLMKGEIVAKKHARIGPMEIALLAASGRKEVLVTKHISIGVLSIGSNLEEPGEPLKPGFVYDVNRITLISLLKEKGFHSLDFGIVDNKLTPIQNKIGDALKKVDLLVMTGPTNNRDLLQTVLEKCFKADIHYGNVNMKPGKSTIFATCEIDDAMKYFLCLSGNPTSAFTAAHMFLIPLVNELYHNCTLEQTTLSARIENQYTLHSRPRVAWTILEWSPNEKFALAFSKGNAISDKLVSAAGANALLLLPAKEPAKKSPKPKEAFTTAILVKLPKRFNEHYKNFCNAYKPPIKEKEKKYRKRKNNYLKHLHESLE